MKLRISFLALIVAAGHPVLGAATSLRFDASLGPSDASVGSGACTEPRAARTGDTRAPAPPGFKTPPALLALLPALAAPAPVPLDGRVVAAQIPRFAPHAPRCSRGPPCGDVAV